MRVAIYAKTVLLEYERDRLRKRVICGPTSQKKVSAVWALMPGMAVRSTPRLSGRMSCVVGSTSLSLVKTVVKLAHCLLVSPEINPALLSRTQIRESLPLPVPAARGCVEKARALRNPCRKRAAPTTAQTLDRHARLPTPPRGRATHAAAERPWAPPRPNRLSKDRAINRGLRRLIQ